jgi:hypothetical protein
MSRKYREHKPIASTAEFLKAINEVRSFVQPKEHRGDESTVWFRGQHSVNWPLTPKIYRREFLGANEAETRYLFQSRAIQLLHGRQPVDQWEWYFLMQHHGAPTRLLDWTENPLIALYFAAKAHDRVEDAVVWVLAPFWLNGQNTFLKRRGVYGPILPTWHEAKRYLPDLEAAFAGDFVRTKFPAAIEAPHVDVRLHAQAGRFVVFGRNIDLSKIFDIRSNYFGLGRIPVRKGATRRIEDELAVLGVQAASVFPDVSGLGEYVCDQWRKRPRA